MPAALERRILNFTVGLDDVRMGLSLANAEQGEGDSRFYVFVGRAYVGA